MPDWTLHWLEASGDLTPWRDRISSEIEEGRRRFATVLEVPRLDILIHRTGAVIGEIGMTGFSSSASSMWLSVDPDNPNFPLSLANETLQRQVIHAAHHCLRWAGPGYGVTLGEALVSEGLAGRFASILYDSPPEPWERAVAPAIAAGHFPDAATLAAPAYDHRAWFFGASSSYPRWLGYTLGYLIVGAWLDREEEVAMERFVTVTADEVLSAWPRT